MKEIDITKLKKNTKIEVSKGMEYILKPSSFKQISLEKELIFEFNNSNVSSKIEFKCVAKENADINLKIVLLNSKNDIVNVQVSLEVYILNLSDSNSIRIEPILLIPQQGITFEHKVTIGSPNEKWIQYLESRGLEYKQAVNLIAQSFIR